MAKKNYSDEFKKQILKECQEVGNTALVARRHEISKHTVYSWQKKAKKNGSIEPLPKDAKKRLKEVKKRLQDVSTENDQLKKLLADKELELAILRELRDKTDPQ